jgi:hypothetical protein
MSRSGGVTRRVSSTGTAPAPGTSVQHREYRDPAAMLRWAANRLPSGTLYQITSHGELWPTYLGLEGFSGSDEEAGHTGPDDLYTAFVGWRRVLMADGPRTVADLLAAERRIFLPGTVDLRILRW